MQQALQVHSASRRVPRLCEPCGAANWRGHKKGATGGSLSVLFGLALVLFTSTATAEPTQAVDSAATAFLQQYCIACHGPDEQNADRRFDTLALDVDSPEQIERWQEVVDQLNLGNMPPPDAQRHPADQQAQQLVERLTASLAAARKAHLSTGGQTVLRRLNRTEYDRTVRHLLALEPLLADPTASFPPDAAEHGFDNVGSALVTSDYLVQQYLQAADVYVRHAALGGEQPPSRTYTLHAPFYRTGNRHDGQDVPGRYQNIRKSTADEGGFLWLEEFERGVPFNGYYKVRFRAQGVNRSYHYPEELVGVRKDEPLRVAIVAGNADFGDLETLTSSDRLLAEFELPDDEPEWLEATIWLDAGYQPRFTFPNGPAGVKPLRRRLVLGYPHDFEEYILNYLSPDDQECPPQYRERLGAARQHAIARGKVEGALGVNDRGSITRKNTRDGWAAFYRGYQGPRVRMFEVQITGPIYERWPPASFRALYGDHQPTIDNAEPIVRRFASRAFRRPLREEELSPLVELVEQRHAKGDAAAEAINAGIKAVLCSPVFLYLEEPAGPLDDYALASRLSYFLWSSMPDEELLSLAEQRQLREPGVLEQQARRMLADSRAAVLAERFTARWLQLYKIGSMPPDPARFRQYYMGSLEEAMQRETQLFFQHVLEHNLPITTFLDSDFAIVNSSLARLYGIEGVRGQEFRPVSLSDRRRGGLLGQASVLTASANGIDTSPIIRGIWVLENLLGTPPAPPPPDIEPLEPDIRGATTIRDQLARHRTVAACNSCHRKIDPLGFALENYDPIGAWRTRYPRGGGSGVVIDASGELPDGRQFDDIVGLKDLLLERSDQFSRCLAEKLLTYALGRTLEPADRGQVDELIAKLNQRGGGLQDLLLLVVESQAFRTK